jgi:Mycothiol maleylpyruvate isomerase N-terminal domain
MTTTIDVTTLEKLGHHESMSLQEHELACTLRMLRSLDDEAWSTPTDCPAWDICAMYHHVLGACEAGASMRENIHQLRRGRAYRRQHGGPLEAALSEV